MKNRVFNWGPAAISLLVSCGEKDKRIVHEDGTAPAREAAAPDVPGGDADDRAHQWTLRDEARARAKEFDRRMDAARMSFGQKDIPAALAELDEALELDPDSATLFNLRGSCHVELRDFESALADFRKAAGRNLHNPSIRFNIAEVLFVTKRWEESLAGFEEIRDELTDPTLAALVDFKILLCNEALGHSEEFQAGMIARQHDEEGPSRYFTRAAGAYHSNVPDEARKQLTAAKRHFPDPATLAPWLDTLVEFGWLAEFP